MTEPIEYLNENAGEIADVMIWACPVCHSTDLYRDAVVSVNDPEAEPNVYDAVSCSECGYDGHRYLQVFLTQSEADETLTGGFLTESQTARGKEDYL